MKSAISRGYKDCSDQQKIVVTIQCESKPLFYKLLRDIKTSINHENFKRKQADQSRLEYKITYSSSENTSS